MNKNNSVKRLEEKIDRIRRKLLSLGPMHPGSISQQYHACGTPSCRCHHPTRPKKHGPYNKLTYVHRGKPVCRFVAPAHVRELKARLTAYKMFRDLVDKWIELSIQRAMIDFFGSARDRRPKSSPKEQ